MTEEPLPPASEEEKFEHETGKTPDDSNVSIDFDDEIPRTEGGDPIEGLHGTDDVDLMAGIQGIREEVEEGLGTEQD